MKSFNNMRAIIKQVINFQIGFVLKLAAYGKDNTTQRGRWVYDQLGKGRFSNCAAKSRSFVLF